MKNTLNSKRPFLKSMILLLGLLALPGLSGMVSMLKAQPNAWINEFHYDNLDGDTLEFVEVVIENPALYNLADFSMVLYNGNTANNGLVYDTKLLSDFVVGDVVGDYTFYYYIYPKNGVQNGSRDGFALTYLGAVIPGQLLSYEGTFTAGAGPAAGMTSVDVGVSQTNSTPLGLTLQLSGTGTGYGDFTWEQPAPVTMGAINNNQVFGQPIFCGDILSFSFQEQYSPAVIDSAQAEVRIEVFPGTNLNSLVATFSLCTWAMAFDMTNQSFNEVISSVSALDYSDTVYWQVLFGDESDYRIWAIIVSIPQVDIPSIVINEVDYDQPGIDYDEFIELKNTDTQAVNLLNMRVELINASMNPPGSYRSIVLPDYILAPGDYYVICGSGGNVPNCNFAVAGVNADLIQNGAPDAIALYTADGIVLDMLSYEGNTLGYTEGSGVGLIDNGDAHGLGLSRWPDGFDSDNNSADFRLLCVTPGQANVMDTGLCVCTILDVVVETISECDPLANTYFAELTVEFLKEPGSGYLVVNGVDFPIQTSPQTIVLNSLPSNGLPVNLEIYFSENPGCTYYSPSVFIAPASCGSCSFLDAHLLELGDCDSVTNTYSVMLAFTAAYYTSDSIGVQIGTQAQVLPYTYMSLPLPYVPDTFEVQVLVEGLVADGLPVSIQLFNPDEPGCSLFEEALWTAPANCFIPPAIVINEVDYDQPSTDDAEFIELKNTSAHPVHLLGWKVVLVNGGLNPPSIYRTIMLPDTLLAPDAYFVICGNPANVPNCDFVVAGAATNMIQNGNPDALALLDPYDGIVDALSYGGNTTGYTEGSGIGLFDNASSATHGLSRFPDGVDTDMNNVDFIYSCITPGEPNTSLVGYCGPFHNLNANVYYDNDFQTPLPDVPVSLYRNGVLVSTQITDMHGQVSFSGIVNGYYTFGLDAAFYPWGWGGVNSLDALIIAKHFAGLISLNPFSQAVGDVMMPVGLNSSDALAVVQRFAGLISSFIVGDWYTVQPPLDINNLLEDSQFDIDMPVRCFGDVNGSYVPPLKKEGLQVLVEGVTRMQDGLLEVPVALDGSLNLGAVSLEILLPAHTSVIDAQMDNGDQVLFSQDGQILRLAWFNILGMEVKAGESFMNLMLKVDQVNDNKDIQVLPSSSIGDADGVEVRHLNLVLPTVVGGDDFLRVYPNPATSQMNIDLLLRSDQAVVLEVFNMLGELVQQLDLGMLDAGLHHQSIDVSSLDRGAYLIRMNGSLETLTTRISIVR